MSTASRAANNLGLLSFTPEVVDKKSMRAWILTISVSNRSEYSITNRI